MGYLFALFPSFLDSIAVFLDKYLLSKYDIDSTTLTIYSGFFAFVIGIVVWVLNGFTLVDTKSALIITLTGVIGLFYLFSYFKALTYDEASRVGSLFQFVPVMVIILSFLFLGESLRLTQYIGSAFIIGSGFLLSLKKLDSGIFNVNKAFLFMLLSSTLSALVYVLFRLGVKDVGFWNVLPYEGLGGGIAALMIVCYKDNFKKIKKSVNTMTKTVFVYLTLIEAISRMARLSLFFALTLIASPIVSVLQGFQPLVLLIMGVVISVWFPKELKEVINIQTISLKFVAVIGIFYGLYLIFS